MADSNQNEANSTQPQENAGNGSSAAGEGSQHQAPEFDYEKLAALISGKQTVTEDTVLKSYFKQQGLSAEEMTQAINAFKQQKAEKTPDVSGLQNQVAEAQKAAIRAQIENKALLMAGEIGVDLKTMPYVIRMADMKDVVADGKISDEKLKASLGKVLEDIPQLKARTEDNQGSGFRIGADTGSTPAGSSANSKLRAAFGLKDI